MMKADLQIKWSKYRKNHYVGDLFGAHTIFVSLWTHNVGKAWHWSLAITPGIPIIHKTPLQNVDILAYTSAKAKLCETLKLLTEAFQDLLEKANV